MRNASYRIYFSQPIHTPVKLQKIPFLIFFFPDCPSSVTNPDDLVDDGTRASCAILSSCSSVDCCYDFEYLGINLHIYLNIDTCNYVIKGGIEQMTFEYHFFTYTWGKFKNSKFIYNCM